MGQFVVRGLLGLVCLTATSGTLTADVYDLTNKAPPLGTGPTEAWINSAYFNTNITQPGGNGIFEPFVELSGSAGSTTDAYNIDAAWLDNTGGSGNTKNRAISVSQIPYVSVTQTDGSVIRYFEFSLDANEPGSDKKQYLSVDQLRIYSGSDPTLKVTPDANGFLNALGTLRYDLDQGKNNSVRIDASNFSGSGQADLLVYIPVWYAPSVNLATITNEYVFLYSMLGATGTIGTGQSARSFSQDGNDDNWGLRGNDSAVPQIPVDPQGGVVPEPTSLALAGIGLALRTLRRRKNPTAAQAA